MKTRFTFFLALFFLAFTQSLLAQYVQVNDTYTAQQLVDALVDGSCAQISNITFKGAPNRKSSGYFTNGGSTFPFSNGIVLSSGYAASVTGPNDSLLSEGGTEWLGDNDLETALNVSNTINATILEFDFVPFTDKISFDYIFASEQYLTSINSQNQCNYTDGFAFLIKEVSGSAPYKNLAVVPGTNIPVKVNTVRGEGVCPSANEQYFGGFSGPNHPINFNGQTIALKAETDVNAGSLYHIKLVVADQGNNLYDSAIFLGGGSFRNTTDLGPDRLLATKNPLCPNETITLDATTMNASGYQWSKNGAELPGKTAPLYTVTSEGEYTVAIKITATCFSKGKIKIEYASLPPSQTYTLLQCDENNDGITNFNLNLATEIITNNNTAFTVQYFVDSTDANLNINPIVNTTAFQNITLNQQISARVTNQYGCFAISTLTLLTSANGLTNPDPQAKCDEDGIEDGLTSFDLTISNAQILQNLPANLQLRYFTSGADALASINPISTPENFINTAAYNQTIYGRIYNGSDCYSIIKLNLIVYTFGNGFKNEDVILCEDNIITLDAGAGFTSYSWNTVPIQNTQTININQPGSYTITAVNSNGCKGSKTFTVLPSAPATGAIIDIDDFRGNNNSITITPQGIGKYEFSIDGKNYQNENVFKDLITGKYTIYINDKNGCGNYSEVIYILDYQKFFTPNNDNINDVWRIPYLSLLPKSEVLIFDRYGKLLTGFKGTGPGWDGTYNGRPLPATDYWFVIHLETGRTIKGHFSLLR
ncbi:T9SS type B sorting domain-containing protein [Flavobacterium cerinum]|nr:choice-of-anchor L domain-containing protein [Flavobacterium cerinum]